MSRKSNRKDMPFVTKVDVMVAEKMLRDLKEKGFSISKPQYTIFVAKNKGVVCTFYQSGKLVVQGKEKKEFIEFYLEPYVLEDFSYTYKEELVDTTARIGADEAGKGDFFGPLCIASVFADASGVKNLVKKGIQDSKKMTDTRIEELGTWIRQNYAYHLVCIPPPRYNELYEKIQNLNFLLAWGHSAAIASLVEKTSCKKVIIDQFANENVMLQALRKKGLSLDLTQKFKGEEDVVVAAASIVARHAFIEGLKQMDEKFGFHFPKGASQAVINAGINYIKKFGKDALKDVSKKHFKTTDSIIYR